MQHSTRVDSFCAEDELFFGSYEAEHVNGGGSLTLEFEAEAQPPTAERIAHFTRFRRPVAWIMVAMGSLSLVALGQHGSRQNSRRAVVAHVGATTAGPTSAAAKNLAAAASAVFGRAVLANAAEQTSEAPWSWSELVDSAIALVIEPTELSTSSGKRYLLADSATQASQVNDFTSELLSMCRNVPS